MAKRKAAAESASDRIERQLAAGALRKVQAGAMPSSQERAALKRLEKAQEAQRRWDYYRTCPKKDYREMSGRSARVLIDQAKRYGMPIAGRTVDLAALLKWLHDFLATNSTRLNAPDSDDPMMAGVASPALERYRDERAKLARLERLQKEGLLLPRDPMHQLHGKMAAVIRSSGDKLLRDFGEEAYAILTEALDDVQREVDRAFGDTPGSEAGDDGSRDRRKRRRRAVPRDEAGRA